VPLPDRPLSPNQLDKRRQIIEAAKQILLSAGPAACTSRELAKQMGITKGLLHYYFANVEEIVELALADLLSTQLDRLRRAGEVHADPRERFWAVVEEYLDAYEEEPGLTLLWFEWWVKETRAGHVEAVRQVQYSLIDLLSELLGDVGVPDAETRARALLSYVIGVLVRRAVHPQSFEELKPEVAALCRIDG
jgi:AcrR family transcriptional regulator